MAIKILKNNKSIVKVMNYSFMLFFAVWLVAGAIMFYDTHQDQKLVFVRKNSIDLYQDSTTINGKKIGTVKPEDHVKVLRVLYLNGQLVINVLLNNKQRGWILKTSDVDLVNGP